MPEVLDTADRIHSAAIRLLRLVRTADDETGLSAPRLSVLSVLVFAGPQSLNGLAKAEQVTAPTMSSLVAGLQAAGLVAKRVDETDGRALRIEATPRGRALVQRGRKRRLALLEERLGALGHEELALLESAAALIQRVAAR